MLRANGASSRAAAYFPQYECYSEKISKVHKVLARHRQRTGRRLKLLYDKRRRFLRHALNSMVRKIVEELKEGGVSEVVVGYPKDTVRNHGNKLTVNFWNYGYTIRRFKEIGEELGIGVTDVAEPNTSKSCSLCGDAHKNGRIRRGLYRCPRMGKAMNADLNGAVNILHIPESLGSRSRGQLPGRDRGNGLKASLVYRWTNGAGWVQIAPTSCEVMKMKAVNHKLMIRPEGTLAIHGGEEVRTPPRRS
jgi:putative transposase